MRLKRKIDDYLVEWKNNKNRLPLIVKVFIENKKFQQEREIENM